ncbi:MAG: PBECR4 domain-containing protein [Desulfitobacteriaceae bacterium]
MTLNCLQLYNSSQNPRINDITLDILREYYATYLYPFKFQYEIELVGSTHKNIVELKFDKENFCHLLGIESIVRYNIPSNHLTNYKGLLGWNNIENGIINFSHLKSLNKGEFKNQKSRFVFFYLIPKLLEAPKAVLYDTTIMSRSTVDCEILLYDELQRAYVHIGIKKDDVLGYFVPKTFLIEKITQNNDGLQYITSQQAISVNKLNI